MKSHGISIALNHQDTPKIILKSALLEYIE